VLHLRSNPTTPTI